MDWGILAHFALTSFPFVIAVRLSLDFWGIPRYFQLLTSNDYSQIPWFCFMIHVGDDPGPKIQNRWSLHRLRSRQVVVDFHCFHLNSLGTLFLHLFLIFSPKLTHLNRENGTGHYLTAISLLSRLGKRNEQFKVESDKSVEVLRHGKETNTSSFCPRHDKTKFQPWSQSRFPCLIFSARKVCISRLCF